MSNKIDNIASQLLTRSPGAGNGSARVDGESSGSGDVKAPAAVDSVKLSKDASNLQQLENRVRDASGIDTKRVEAVKAAIANGTYNIDAKATADGLINAERLLRP